MEAELGRPRRRVEVIEERLQQGEEELRAIERVLTDPAAGSAKRTRWETRRERKREEVAQLRSRREKISKNGFIAESTRTTLGHCPYPMRLFACRQWWGEKKPERWSARVVTPDLHSQDWPARRVGVFYNERQIIEPGIKEGKGVFASRHLPTRHEAGIALYQELVLLAQNLIRWFRHQVQGRTPLARSGVKPVIHLAANSRALVLACSGAIVLQFAADTPSHGLTLSPCPQVSYQLWFPLLDDGWLAPAGP